VKRLWAIRLGELFSSTSKPEIIQSKFPALAEATVPALMDIWNDVSSNPLAAGQSGLVSAAYVFVAISHSTLSALSSSKIEATLKKAQITRVALAMEPKPSFLLNQRIYSKLSGDDEFKWFTRALSSVAADIITLNPESAVAIGWSQAVIFCICSSTIRPALRKDACQALSQLYAHNPECISNIIVAGLWQWRRSIEAIEIDTASIQNIHQVVLSICLSPTEISGLGGGVSESIRKNQMISMLVLSRPELLPRVSWIDLCLKVGVDPGELAKVSGDSLIQQILAVTDFQETVNIHLKQKSDKGILIISSLHFNRPLL